MLYKKRLMKIKFDSCETHFADLAESIHLLNQQAVQEYTPIVDTILRSRSQDKHHIENTLDGLLDFCGYEPTLQMYRSLCRHYWDIDSSATAFYIEAYQTAWDSEKVEKRHQECRATNGVR